MFGSAVDTIGIEQNAASFEQNSRGLLHALALSYCLKATSGCRPSKTCACVHIES